MVLPERHAGECVLRQPARVIACRVAPGLSRCVAMTASDMPVFGMFEPAIDPVPACARLAVLAGCGAITWGLVISAATLLTA